MRFEDEQGVVTAFHELAKEYCEWAEGPAARADALEALRLLASLYDVALILPERSPSDLSQGDAPDPETRAIYQRLKALPIQSYHDTFDPLANPPVEAIAGDVADDLHDIYLDLWRGLRRYEAGQRDDAVFEWRFSFGVHWGRHATSAIRVLHQWVMNPGGDS